MNRRSGFVALLASILILLTANLASAQAFLSITLTVAPLSGDAPFSPLYQFGYSGAVGSIRILIYWGDGSSSDLTYCGYNCPGHTYTIAGTYTITVAIWDSTGRTASDSKTIIVYPARPQTTYSIQVGVWGDEASRGNMGVGAEIRTHLAPLVGQELSATFWVGDNLDNGAFIQFGYSIDKPGYYCTYGEMVGDHDTCLGASRSIGYDEAHWFWEYWPDGNVIHFYYVNGPAYSAGLDESWHLYQIWPNVVNGWNFVLDGKSVWSFNKFQVTKSKDPAFMVAEEVTSAPSASGSLGPVEFRNLSYLTEHITWQRVSSLKAISGCGALTPSCGNVPYGITVLDANHIVAGSGQQLRQDGARVWPPQYKLTITSPFPSSGDGWYDQGTTASFSTDTAPRITNTLGILIFVGWHDERGNLVTISGTGSILMDGPHTLNAQWLGLDYLIPIAVAALLGSAIVSLERRRRYPPCDNERVNSHANSILRCEAFDLGLACRSFRCLQRLPFLSCPWTSCR
jgi:PKD repeat protein